MLKSPPYNPSSNGQAERLVRTVKDVLKKFLLEPEIMELGLEDQINLFLINFRHYCVTKEGYFPAEKVLSYKAKTILDLVNPKFHYKKNLKVTVPSNDENEQKDKPIDKGKIDDPLDNLMVGDEVWYRNNKPHDTVRWLKANFIKKFSINTFQVEIGNVRIMAHRNQLRATRGRQGPRPNVLVNTNPPMKERERSIDVEADFVGFPSEESRLRRKRRFNQVTTAAGTIDDEISGLRRSKRIRKEKIEECYIYKK